MVLRCRFYAEKYPDIEETVVVNVKQIEEMGAYVRLLEYNNIGEKAHCSCFDISFTIYTCRGHDSAF